jgi:hypothetical protein
MIGNAEALSSACADCKDLFSGAVLGKPAHRYLRLLSPDSTGRYVSYVCTVCRTTLISVRHNVLTRDWVPAPWRLREE